MIRIWEEDKTIVDYILDEFKKKEGIDLSSDTTAMTRIREAAEKAKIELSTIMETDINLPFISHDPTSGSKNLEMRMTRAKLEDLVNPIIEKCKPSIEKALSDAKITPQEINKIVMVGGPTRIPAVKKFVESVLGKEPETGVDPMEAVAFGAAIQAGIISGDVSSDIVLLDVTPLTLGIETLGGVREPLIERNTTIPTSKSKTFTTAADNQTAVTIHIVQGERPMAQDNVSLGSFNLSDLPPAPRGVPQIEVKFDIDANGIINVTATDTATKKEAKITIESKTKLTEDEINKLKEDAEKYADADKNKKEQVEIKNEAESLRSITTACIAAPNAITKTPVSIPKTEIRKDLLNKFFHRWYTCRSAYHDYFVYLLWCNFCIREGFFYGWFAFFYYRINKIL